MPKAKALNKALQYKRAKVPQLGMFSTLDELIENAPQQKNTAAGWKGYLTPGHVLEREGVKFPLKREELDYSGLLDVLNADPAANLTSADLLAALEKSRPEFNTSERDRSVNSHIGWRDRLGDRGDMHAQPKYENWAHDGDNYSESLTRSPSFGDYPTHFQSDVLSHSRATEHVLPTELGEPKRMRLIEEIQSDRHRDARKAGYKGNHIPPTDAEVHEFFRLRNRPYTPEEYDGYRQEMMETNLKYQIEDTPFKETGDYGGLELRKQLLNAANRGEDYLGLVRGKDQIERYGEKEGRDEGMEHIYDKIYPSALQKLARQYGLKTSDVEVPTLRTKPSAPIPQTLQELGLDLPDFIGHALYGDDPELLGSVRDLAIEYGQSDPANPMVVRKVERIEQGLQSLGDQLEEAISNRGGGVDSGMLPGSGALYREIEELLHSLDRHYQSKTPKEVGGSIKSFPSIELSPEDREKIKRVGVPLWSAAGAAVLGSHGEEPETFAEGGQAKKKSYARAASKSLANAFLPEEMAESVEDKLARLLAGLQSQVMTRDPETGETYLGGWQRMKDSWAGTPKRLQRKGKPGLIDETLSLPTLAALVPGGEDYVPEWAIEAADRVDQMHKSVHDEMDLPEAKGFAQNAAEGAGVMLGQVPLPLIRLKAIKAAQLAAPTRLGRVGQVANKMAGAAPEWFSPTIDPSVANYASGAAFGGALGAYSDYSGDRAAEEESAAPALAELARRYTKTGTMIPGFAEGGKIGGLHQALKALSMNPHSDLRQKSNMLEDPVENLKYAASETMNPTEQAEFSQWLKTQEGVDQLDETAINRLLQLHSKLMKTPDQLKPNLNTGVKIKGPEKPINPENDPELYGKVQADSWEAILKKLDAPFGE